jgi:hypothetical protein
MGVSLGVGVLMLAYVLLGCWTLASPESPANPGGLEPRPPAANLQTRDSCSTWSCGLTRSLLCLDPWLDEGPRQRYLLRLAGFSRVDPVYLTLCVLSLCLWPVLFVLLILHLRGWPSAAGDPLLWRVLGCAARVVCVMRGGCRAGSSAMTGRVGGGSF